MNADNTTFHATAAPRRGTVLIFALAILAVLALLGAAYVTRANLDRVSAEASVRRATLGDQPEIAVDHIRALLTADLYGNKIVRRNTPRTVDGRSVETSDGSTVSGPVSIWPDMFEDGEHWDYPSVDEIQYSRNADDHDRYTFLRSDIPASNQARERARLRYNADLDMFQTARADDAWLSATEPVDWEGNEPIGSYNGEWNTWPQITNPRSAYEWVDDADGNGNGAWVRGDGGFADLAMFFDTQNARDRRRGDPAADLLDRAAERTRTRFYDPDDADALLNLDDDENSALLGVEQRGIYAYQMNHLDEWYENAGFDPDNNDADFEPNDERFWADTDADGRPDARWTILDDLDGQSGMRWVVAMRIADSSAAVNLNTSLEGLPPKTVGNAFASPGLDPWQLYGDGATPMDIDVTKLILESASDVVANSASSNALITPLRHPDVVSYQPDWIRTGLRRHLRAGLGFSTDLIEAMGPRDRSFAKHLDRSETDNINKGLADLIGWDVDLTGDDEDFYYPGSDDQDFNVTRAQREAYWRLYAANPAASAFEGAGYDLSEEVELRAVFGANFAGVKAIEANFDGVYESTSTHESRLPAALQESARYPDRDSLGPMRSGEHTNAVLRDDRTGVDLPDTAISGNDYTQQDRIERIQKDVRRSLTVASGASARSVVPAIGLRAVPEGRLKPLVNEGFWGLDPGREPTFDSNLDVEDAFEAFTWALAPLATNRPLTGALMGGSGNTWVNRYDGFYSQNEDFHYGGGASGPAEQWASDVSITGNFGPTYALFRAASLAVNLKDAVDNEGDNPTPTVARLLPAPALFEGQGPQASDLIGVNRLTTRFAHGDIDRIVSTNPADPNIIPNSFVRPENGVTFVGLERQPFISEVFALCMYRFTSDLTPTPLNPPPETVNIDGAGTTVSHSIIAVELANPWDENIDLVDYKITLTDGANEFTLEEIDGIIPPGSRFVIIGHNADGDLQATQSVTELSGDAGEFWSIALTDDEIDNAFDGWNRAQTSVLLYREGPSGEHLVDRMRNPGTTSFPYNKEDAMLTSAVVDITDDMADSFGAWYAVASNFTRQDDAPTTGGGFPTFVLERPDFNQVNPVNTTPSEGAEGWHGDEPARSHFEMVSTDTLAEWNDAFTLGDDNVNGAGPVTLQRPFQLFVPDGPLVALSELGMISAFAHTYIHSNTGAPEVSAINDANPATSAWSTVGEQLAKDYHLNYNAANTGVPSSTDEANPYLGVLDPTRYILGAQGDLRTGANTNLPSLPDSLTVPLALRVFDAFEVLGDSLRPTGRTLVPGRVNINTAPKRVLATLPLVLPVDYRAASSVSLPTELNQNMGLMDSGPQTLETAYARLNGMIRYKERLRRAGTDRWSSDHTQVRWDGWDVDAIDEALGAGLGGMRNWHTAGGAVPSPGPGVNDHRKGRGFVSLGELSVLANWTSGVEGAATVNAPEPNTGAGQHEQLGFLELAEDTKDNTLVASNRNLLDVRRQSTLTIDELTPADPTDDPEERLALFRAVSNVASTRSDVYHAWYIVRAYAPAAIESVTVEPGLSEQERADLLNDLPVAFEERGFLVLDRSNVSRPTDRPRVLLRTVLDSTTAAN